MSIEEGFAGMRVKEGTVSFQHNLPDAWQSLRFKINFRDTIYELYLGRGSLDCTVDKEGEFSIIVNDKTHAFSNSIALTL